MGNALNAIAQSEQDIAVRLKLHNQARQAFESAGYLERQGIIMGNLALAYGVLGLDRRAYRLQVETVELAHSRCTGKMPTCPSD